MCSSDLPINCVLIDQVHYDSLSYCKALVLTLDCIVLGKHTLKSAVGLFPYPKTWRQHEHFC